jgi:polyisoprenoid-binding protein YceI
MTKPFWPMLLLGAAGAILAAVALAQGGVVDLAQSRISFVGTQMGVPTEGVFKKFSATIEFDPSKPESAKVEVRVDLSSVDLGNRDFTDEVKSRNWFNVTEFPAATFVSTGVKVLGDGRYEASGRLTIKGRTRDVRLPFTVKQGGGGRRFEGALTLVRSVFGVGVGEWADPSVVADEVQVRFKLWLPSR